ncbi:MAG: hypothetical protein AAGH15_03335 [Myxococcota bacterium]
MRQVLLIVLAASSLLGGAGCSECHSDYECPLDYRCTFSGRCERSSWATASSRLDGESSSDADEAGRNASEPVTDGPALDGGVPDREPATP